MADVAMKHSLPADDRLLDAADRLLAAANRLLAADILLNVVGQSE